MNKVELYMVKPSEQRASWKHRVVIGITEINDPRAKGYVVECPNGTLKLHFVAEDEYVKVKPDPKNELEVLRRKVYDYEMMITRLLSYQDIIIIAAVRNELEHIRRGTLDIVKTDKGL